MPVYPALQIHFQNDACAEEVRGRVIDAVRDRGPFVVIEIAEHVKLFFDTPEAMIAFGQVMTATKIQFMEKYGAFMEMELDHDEAKGFNDTFNLAKRMQDAMQLEAEFDRVTNGEIENNNVDPV